MRSAEAVFEMPRAETHLRACALAEARLLNMPHHIVIGRLRHLDAHNLARLGHSVVDVGDAVHLDRLPGVPSGQQVVALRTRPFDEHLQRLPHQRLVLRPVDAPLQSHDFAPPLAGDLGRHLIGHGRRRGPLLGAELEDAQPLKARELDKRLERLVILLGLARQPADERRAQRDFWNALAQPGDELANKGRARPPSHGAQKPIADVLQRNVEIGHHLFLASENGDELVRDGAWIGVVQSDPAQTLDLDERPQQSLQPRPSSEVVSVSRQILRDEADLDATFTRQRPRLGHHVLNRPRTLRSANRGDDAKSATVVTALAHLHKRRETRCRSHARHRRRMNEPWLAHKIARQIPVPKQRRHLVEPPCADKVIDLGHGLHQLRHMPLRQAPSGHELLTIAPGPQLAHLQKRVDRLLLRVANKRAGIDDNDLRLLWIVRPHKARIDKSAEQYLAVHAIFGAPQRNKMNPARAGLSLRLGLSFHGGALEGFLIEFQPLKDAFPNCFHLRPGAHLIVFVLQRTAIQKPLQRGAI